MVMRGLVIVRALRGHLGVLRTTTRPTCRSLCASSTGPPSFSMQHSNVPANHFADFQTLRSALVEFVAEHGTAKMMPTQVQLGFNGRNDLTRGISLYHGGMVAVADRLGWEMAQEQLPDNYWQDIKVVERELLKWIGQHGTPGTMPTHTQLNTSGRADISRGISKYHGGIRALTTALGLVPGRNPPSVKPRAHWREWANVQAEMAAVSEACGVPGKMPTQHQLQANGFTSLVAAITNEHGGMYESAERLSLPMQHSNVPANHFAEFRTLRSALVEFVAEHGTATMMPTNAELKVHKRSDLTGAMTVYHGGSVAVADRLGWEMTQDHLPDQYWKDIKVVERELLKWIGQHGTPGTMPTHTQLDTSGRADISRGISKYHGGIRALTTTLGLVLGRNPPSAKPRAHWREWANVQAEMAAVSEACGVPGKMPTLLQLRANGFTSLSSAISNDHGGVYKVAERLK